MPHVEGFLRVTETGYPDNSLPGVDRPIDPGFGNGPPLIPGHDLPSPPPGVWPPPIASHPIVPAPPETPPGTIWPPAYPAHPDQGLPPGSPGKPDQGLPSNKFWIVAGIPGYGWRYVCVDPSLRPDQGLPPHAAPKGA